MCKYNNSILIKNKKFFMTLSFFFVCRYWLFGERQNEGAGDAPARRHRGWFPRSSVIEVIANGHNLTSYAKHD